MTEDLGRLPFRQRFAYGVGHVLNDLCAGAWFCYILVFFHNVVQFDNVLAGYLMLLGQVVDGICTPLVGMASDRMSGFFNYGKRKSWHLLGTASVALCFAFCFNECLGCTEASETVKFIYYAVFCAMFQAGWAAIQISHLSLIPELTTNESERVELNAIRVAFTGVSNIMVYLVAWFLFHGDSGDSTSVSRADAPKFRNLAFFVVGTGVLFSVIFHLGTREGGQQTAVTSTEEKRPHNIHGMTWSMWFKKLQFYQVGIIYMCTRLIMNLTQVYAAMFLTETLHLQKEHIATVPLVVFLSGFLISFIMKPTNRILGRKPTYLVGILFVIASCIWMWLLQPQIALEMFGAAVLLGIGNYTLLVTSLSMTADMIGNHVETGAFVYGSMSFVDKVSNGVAVAVLQYMQPCKTEAMCADSSWFYRDTMVVVPGVTASVALLAVITLFPEDLDCLRPYSENRESKSRDEKDRDPEKHPLLHSQTGGSASYMNGLATVSAKGLTRSGSYYGRLDTTPTTTTT